MQSGLTPPLYIVSQNIPRIRGRAVSHSAFPRCPRPHTPRAATLFRYLMLYIISVYEGYGQ